MKTYVVTNIFRCEISHVVEAEDEMQAQEIACGREVNFSQADILADGLHYADTTVEEYNA